MRPRSSSTTTSSHNSARPNRFNSPPGVRTNAPREPLPAAVPTDLQAIVSKLLAYQPERRYSNAAAIRTDLQCFLEGDTPGAVAEYATPATMRIGPPTTARTIESSRLPSAQ